MHRKPLLDLLARYRASHPDEAACADRIRALVETQRDCFERSCFPGHVTASAWLLSPDGRRFLLTHHRKLDQWLQPGGHADGDTDLPRVALREAREETGLDVRLEALLGCYSKPDRDPRGHTVSIIFVAVASGDPVAGDDAREVGVFDPAKTPPLAFDHQQVLADFIRWRERR